MLPSLLLPVLPLLLAAPLRELSTSLLSAVPATQEPTTSASLQEEGEKKQRPRLRDRGRALGQPETPQAPELRRADGSLVEPGVIPQSTSATARTTWGALVDALATDEPMRSFELNFNLRQHSQETTQSNDLTLEFAYLAPRFVHARLESGRTLIRGAQGDYLVDGKETIKLEGREAAADRKTLDEMASIAATFMALTAPSALRLVELQMLEQAPAGIHPKHHQEMKPFLWMRVASPDFFLFTENKAKGIPIYQADLGIDPETKAIRFAVIREMNPDPKLAPSTVFVRMSDHQRRDGFFVPHRIEICNLDPTTTPPRFYQRPTSRLDLKRKTGRLRARLTVEDFTPPR